MKFSFEPESKPLEGYTIKRAINKGGFGEVYYAVSDAGKEVALKLLRENLEIELRGVRQCLNLKHPNLVPIFDIRQDADGDHWIVMEYVAGRTLLDVLQESRAGLSIETVRHWLASISAGLDFLHDRGIVHRDLKPGNIFEENDVIKIGDIGLSKFISESQRGAQTQSVGTVYYMAPEVSRGQYGKELDVYSLGVMLYEMLSGKLPFEGDTPGEILMKHLTELPDLSGVPEAYRGVLRRALEKDPLKRTSSAGALLKEFDAAVAGQSEFVSAKAATARSEQDKLRDEARQASQTNHQRPSPQATSTSSERPFQAWFHENWFYAVPLAVVALWFTPRFLGGPMGLIGGVFNLAVMVGLVLVGYKVFAYIKEEETKRKARQDEYQASAKSDREHPPSPPPKQASSSSRSSGSRLSTPNTVRTIPLNVRMAELLTSFGLASLFSALISTVLFFLTDSIANVPQAITFGLCTLLPSWAILAECKFLEGRKVEGTSRRLRMLVVGGVVGAIIAQINTFLLDPLNFSTGSEHRLSHIGEVSSMSFGWNSQHLWGVSAISPLVFAAFFGLLFSMRRWWWHVDSFRSARLRVSSILGTVLVAALIPLLVGFPQNAGMLWAASLSAVVQLSACWTPRDERRAIVTQPQTHTHRA